MTVAIPRIMVPTPTHGGAPSHSPPDTRYVPGNSIARFLGYFSIGLGLAEILAPDALARVSGVHPKGLLQAYGVREIACGVGILASSRPTGWLWARVAGDALDIATALGNMTAASGNRRHKLIVSAVALAGVTALDVMCSAQLTAAAALTDD